MRDCKVPRKASEPKVRQDSTSDSPLRARFTMVHIHCRLTYPRVILFLTESAGVQLEGHRGVRHHVIVHVGSVHKASHEDERNGQQETHHLAQLGSLRVLEDRLEDQEGVGELPHEQRRDDFTAPPVAGQLELLLEGGRLTSRGPGRCRRR